MNREEFNQLDVKYQADYFNDKLKQENTNFNAICKNIGVSKNTIQNRFKNNGFEPVRSGQKIIGFSQQFGNEITTAQNTVVKNLEMENKKKASETYEINLILKRIELLEQKIKALENGDIRSHENFINTYKNTLAKTFKIDVEVYRELEKIFDKYKLYKKQDIVSSIIKIGIDNIK